MGGIILIEVGSYMLVWFFIRKYETIIIIKLILNEVLIEYDRAEMLIEVENELNFV